MVTRRRSIRNYDLQLVDEDSAILEGIGENVITGPSRSFDPSVRSIVAPSRGNSGFVQDHAQMVN